MKTPKHAARRTEAAQVALEAAFQRLQEGKPRNPRLKALAQAKKMRITIKAVAEEAQCSRTLIGSETCRFLDLRTRILNVDRTLTAQPVVTSSQLNISLRATNAKLRSERQALVSQQALMLARMIEAEIKAKLLEADLAAARASRSEGAAGSEVADVVGTVFKLPTGTRRRP